MRIENEVNPFPTVSMPAADMAPCPGPWSAPAPVASPVGGNSNPYYALDVGARQLSPCLTPSTLPPMMEMPQLLGMVRGAESGGAERGRPADPDDGRVSLNRHAVLVAGAWQRLLGR